MIATIIKAIEWVKGHWKLSLLILAAVLVAAFLLFRSKPAATDPVPAAPEIEQETHDEVETTKQDSTVKESGHKTKVKVTIPPNTVVGPDEPLIVEVEVHDTTRQTTEPIITKKHRIDSSTRYKPETIVKQPTSTGPVLSNPSEGNSQNDGVFGLVVGAGYSPALPLGLVGAYIRPYGRIYLHGGVGAGYHLDNETAEVRAYVGVGVRVWKGLLLSAGYDGSYLVSVGWRID